MTADRERQDRGEVDVVPRLVVAFCAPSPQRVHFIGEETGQYHCPTTCLSTESGQCVWASHLTRDATEAESAEYWRTRALASEGER